MSPKVGPAEFPYSKKGVAAAKKASAAKGMPMKMKPMSPADMKKTMKSSGKKA